MEVLVSTDAVKITLMRGRTETIFVVFTGILHGFGGMKTEEFVRTISDGQFGTAIFVADLKRSWYNDRNVMDETIRILADVRREAKPHRVVTLGNSMGGFGAILLTKLAPIDVAISFVPQFSVDPKLVPAERRWLEYTRQIREFVYSDLSDCFVKGTSYYIFTGSSPEEEMHYSRIPQQENIRCLVLPGLSHNVAGRLKADGLLGTLIELCGADDGEAALSLVRTHYGASKYVSSGSGRSFD